VVPCPRCLRGFRDVVPRPHECPHGELCTEGVRVVESWATSALCWRCDDRWRAQRDPYATSPTLVLDFTGEKRTETMSIVATNERRPTKDAEKSKGLTMAEGGRALLAALEKRQK
jgi:hypothetical protein